MPAIAVLSTAHIHSAGFIKEIARLSSRQRPCAIWDDVPERGRAAATAAGCPFAADLDALLADASVQAFVICAENTRHLPLLERVLPLGRPVMCEKPLATTVADARRIAALQRQHGTPLISGYFLPFSAAMDGVRRLLTAGGLGAVTHAAHRNAHAAAYGRWFDKPELAWFADPDLAGGGAFLDLGTHSVHLLRTLFGPVREVFACLERQAGTYPHVDDWGTALLRCAGGTVLRVEAGWTQQAGPKGLEVFGRERALWATDAGIVTAAGRDAPVPVPPGGEQPTRIERLIALVQGRLDESAWREDLACALDAVAIVEAIYRSAAAGRWEAVATL